MLPRRNYRRDIEIGYTCIYMLHIHTHTQTHGIAMATLLGRGNVNWNETVRTKNSMGRVLCRSVSSFLAPALEPFLSHLSTLRQSRMTVIFQKSDLNVNFQLIFYMKRLESRDAWRFAELPNQIAQSDDLNYLFSERDSLYIQKFPWHISTQKKNMSNKI